VVNIYTVPYVTSNLINIPFLYLFCFVSLFTDMEGATGSSSHEEGKPKKEYDEDGWEVVRRSKKR
jgi:hypothetical protein